MYRRAFKVDSTLQTMRAFQDVPVKGKGGKALPFLFELVILRISRGGACCRLVGGSQVFALRNTGSTFFAGPCNSPHGAKPPAACSVPEDGHAPRCTRFTNEDVDADQMLLQKVESCIEDGAVNLHARDSVCLQLVRLLMNFDDLDSVHMVVVLFEFPAARGCFERDQPGSVFDVLFRGSTVGLARVRSAMSFCMGVRYGKMTPEIDLHTNPALLRF